MTYQHLKGRFIIGTLMIAAAITYSNVRSFAQAVPNTPATPNTVTETTETTTNADGTKTTKVTKKSEFNQAENSRVLEADEKGLKYPIGLSIGSYGAANYYGNTASGISAKADYIFFRPTRHEAMLSVNYFAASSNLSGGIADAALEYRFRFASAGRAYYGLNLGYGFTTGGGSSTGAVMTGTSLGYEFPARISLEFRYTQDSQASVGFAQLMLGTRI